MENRRKNSLNTTAINGLSEPFDSDGKPGTTESDADFYVLERTFDRDGVIGLYSCPDPLSSSICDQGKMELNRTFRDRSWDLRRAGGCHELGHSVGLDHGGACMKASVSSADLYLKSHNVSHINNYYEP